MVENFEEGMAKGSRFKLLDALLARNAGAALSCLHSLLDSGEDEPMALILFLHGQFRLYWQAQRLFARGLRDSQVYENLGISPRRAHFFSKQVRVFSLQQLEAALKTRLR